MSAFHDDISGFGALGPELTFGDSGALSPAVSASGSAGLGGTGTNNGRALDPTMITAPHSDLAIDLVWDNSVVGAPAGFTAAVDAAAKELVTLLHTASRTVLFIDVGWGEIANQFSLPTDAVGASLPNGYLVDYATVAALLALHGDSPGTSNTLQPTTQFLLTSAEAKALGLVSGTSGKLSAPPDGYIGFSDLSYPLSWYMGATGTGPLQLNLQAVALHELTEVMGRISYQGTMFAGAPTYTPLDLFEFNGQGSLSLSANGGYFSTDGGATQMGVFNTPPVYNGSDIGDWASPAMTLPPGEVDAFEALVTLGADPILSPDDIAEMVALGFTAA
jgi:hypothetical protein